MFWVQSGAAMMSLMPLIGLWFHEALQFPLGGRWSHGWLASRLETPEPRGACHRWCRRIRSSFLRSKCMASMHWDRIDVQKNTIFACFAKSWSWDFEFSRFCIPRLLWIQYISIFSVTTLLGMFEGRGKHERFSNDLGWGKGEMSTLHAFKIFQSCQSYLFFHRWLSSHSPLGKFQLKHTHPLMNCELSIAMIVYVRSKVMETFLSAAWWAVLFPKGPDGTSDCGAEDHPNIVKFHGVYYERRSLRVAGWASGQQFMHIVSSSHRWMMDMSLRFF